MMIKKIKLNQLTKNSGCNEFSILDLIHQKTIFLKTRIWVLFEIPKKIKKWYTLLVFIQLKTFCSMINLLNHQQSEGRGLPVSKIHKKLWKTQICLTKQETLSILHSHLELNNTRVAQILKWSLRGLGKKCSLVVTATLSNSSQ